MTGALDFSNGTAKGERGMSVITPPGQAPEQQQAVADAPATDSCLKRLAQPAVGVDPRRPAGHRGVAFSIAAGDKFLSTSNFSLISQNIAVWAVLGVGMTFVIITSGIDLSIGSVLVFSSRGRGQGDGRPSAATAGASPSLGILAALVVRHRLGHAQRLPRRQGQDPAADRHPRRAVGRPRPGPGASPAASTSASVPEALTDFNTYIKILGIPALPFVALVVVIIGGIVLHKTKFGRYTYAIGSNELGARRVGINVDRHLILIYALSGMLAGLGAVLALAQFGTTTIAGQSLTNLNVIAAVVIGGTSIFGGEGSIFGTVVGLFIPAVLQAGFVIIGVEAFWQGVAVGSVLVAAVYVDQSRRAAALRGASSSATPSLAMFKTTSEGITP